MKVQLFFSLQTNREHTSSMGLNTDSLGGLDQNTSFARRAEMAKGDFLQGTIHTLPLLEGAQDYVTHTTTCPFLGYFSALQKKVLKYHPPLQAHAILFSKASVEALGKPVLPQRTAQIHPLSLRMPRTEVRGRGYVITHIWGALARVTRHARCNFRSCFPLFCLCTNPG